jgi:hypothetical protein
MIGLALATNDGEEAVDKELLNEQIQIERKLFSFSLRENPRGRFLKITEDVGGRKDTIIVPATGLDQIRDIVNRAIAANKEAGSSEVPGAE